MSGNSVMLGKNVNTGKPHLPKSPRELLPKREKEVHSACGSRFVLLGGAILTENKTLQAMIAVLILQLSITQVINDVGHYRHTVYRQSYS